MNYEDDELERMRARREQSRNGGSYRSSTSGRSSASNRSGTSNRGGTSGRGSTTSRGSASGRDSGRMSERESAGRSTGTSDGSFKSGYSGPKSGAGNGTRQTRTSGNKRRNSNKKKKMIILTAEILVLLLLVVGAGAWYVYERTFGSLQVIKFNEKEVENTILTTEQLESMKGYMTVACFGVDSRSIGGKQSVGKGTNSDVNLICSVNMDTGEIKLVSVFRDTYLNINDKNSYNKINAAYAAGGPEQAVKALNKNLGLNITQYATFNWKAVADAINILGGVDIELSANELSWINAYITETVKETGVASVQLKKTGLVHMDGVQAVAYGRLRLGDTDYARTERQRIVMQKAFEKAKQADWSTLNNIIQTVTPQLATNVTPADLIPLARNIKKYHMGETSGFPAARAEATVGKYGDCVVPQTLETNVRELHKFLFGVEDYQVPSNVKEYSKHIADATGMYKEGKYIGHVPVDQGISAKGYISRMKQKTDNAAAAKAAAKTTEAYTEESTEESTDESSTEESTDDSTADSTEESGTGEDDWGDDWEEEWETDEWVGSGPGSNGPGSAGPGSNGPTSSTKPNIPSDKRPTDSQTEEYDGPGATGPGQNPGSSGSNNSNPSGSNRPGGSTPTTTAAYNEGPVAPGSSNKTDNSNQTQAAVGPGSGPGA